VFGLTEKSFAILLTMQVAIYWSRRDFRLDDNPALTAAIGGARKPGAQFLPLFILENYMCAGDPASQFGYPQRIFLSRAIPAFAQQFEDFRIFRGTAPKTLIEICERLRGAGMQPVIYVNDDVHPDFYAQIRHLEAAGIVVHVSPDQMTVRPDTVTGAGKQYSVFTPFKNAVWQPFLTAPVLTRADVSGLRYLDAAVLQSLPSHIAADEKALMAEFSNGRAFVVKGEREHRFDIAALTDAVPSLEGWYVNEAEAQERFETYLGEGMRSYADKRDSLGTDGTSRMSLALTWGLVSARWLRQAIQRAFKHEFLHVSMKEGPLHLRAPAQYLTELVWREFYKYLFYHDPDLMDREFQERFRGTIEWTDESEAVGRFEAWIRGETGYPIVDAAMHQIAQTGWMHNRARMIVASVLAKNLGVDWRWGQEYFRAQLFDLDEASNNGGWQWGASVGADPKPIRIFNPYLQAEKYDPNDTYVRRWLGDPDSRKTIEPIVPHAQARSDALARYGLKKSHVPGYPRRSPRLF
jgi:deoxyribodipyrimidine photo-lyase